MDVLHVGDGIEVCVNTDTYYQAKDFNMVGIVLNILSLVDGFPQLVILDDNGGHFLINKRDDQWYMDGAKVALKKCTKTVEI